MRKDWNRVVEMDLEQFGLRLRGLIAKEPDLDSLIAGTRQLVVELTSSTYWFRGFLERLLFDRDFLIGQTDSIWPNEFSLWRSPDGECSVLAYVWEPRTVDVIHDHGSWGVVGSLLHTFEETKYRRVDDGQREDYAELTELSHLVIGPGETTFVLPLDEGIHQTENSTDRLSISVNVYGKPVRRGYVRLFDVPTRKVRRALPPRSIKRLIAVKALGAIGEPWAEETLRKVSALPLPDPIREECQRALDGLSGDRTGQ